MKPSTRSSLPHCLFCSEVCTVPTPQLKERMEGALHCPSLGTHLLHFFILRQLLDIPSEWCAQSLQSVDENGDPGFRLCTGCSAKWVNEAWQTYQKILKLESKMRTIRESIKDRMMKSIKRKPGQRFPSQMGLEGKIKSLVFPDLKEQSLPDDDLPQNEMMEVEKLEKQEAKASHLPSHFLDDFTLDNDPDFNLDDSRDNGDDDIDDCMVHQELKQTTQRRRNKPNIKRKRRRRVRGKTKWLESDEEKTTCKVSPYWRFCKLCSAKFTDSQELESHLVAHEESKKSGGKYDCKICKFPARDNAELEVHTNHRHTNKRVVKTYSCPQCNFVSLTWKVLKVHFQKEHPEIPQEEVADFQLRCNACQREFTNLKSMMVHKKNRHPELFGVQQEAISCDQCSQIFPSRILLKYHINSTHLRVTKFVCDICGKGFRFVKLLERHKIVHRKGIRDREFVCHVCGIDYNYQSQMNKHIAKFHPEVGKKAANKAESADLTSTAATQEELSCKYCDLKTFFKPVMIRHMETHKAEMGHQCDICGKYYTNDQGLKRHKRINHSTSNEVVNCPHCNKPFSSVEYMKTHETKYCKLKHLKNTSKKEDSDSVTVTKPDPTN